MSVVFASPGVGGCGGGGGGGWNGEGEPATATAAGTVRWMLRAFFFLLRHVRCGLQGQRVSKVLVPHYHPFALRMRLKGPAHAATFAYCNPQYRAAIIAGLPAANPQGLQAVCWAIGRISIPARKLQCCSQSQHGISYDPMTHSLSK